MLYSKGRILENTWTKILHCHETLPEISLKRPFNGKYACKITGKTILIHHLPVGIATNILTYT